MEPVEKFDIVKAKKMLVEQHKGKAINLSEEEKNARTRMIEKKVAKLVAHNASLSEINANMNALGVYLLETPKNNNSEITPLSQGSDVTMNAPIIIYDPYTSRWTVTGGGYWKNTNWFNDITNVWVGYIGETKNVGNYDSVGIAFYNTSGTYNTKVISSYGYWTDHNGWTGESYNPSHGDGRYGVAFDYQDVIKLQRLDLWIDPEDVTYLGNGFAASITYDSNFTNYNGYARSFYVRTWSKAKINSISFGVSGKQFGVNFNISDAQNSFQVFSGSDTTF